MSNTTQHIFTETEILYIRIVFTASASLSFLGASFIIISHIVSKSSQHGSVLRKLVLCLACSDLGYAISCLPVLFLPISSRLSPIHDEQREMAQMNVIQFIACMMQGSGIQYFQLSSFLWTSAIAFHAFSAYVWKKSRTDLSNNFKWYILVCWGLPIIPVVVLILLGAVALSDDCWCWINVSYSYLRFALFWGPAMFIWIFNCVCYYLVRRAVSDILSFMETNAQRRMLAYIGVFLVVGMIPLGNRVVLQFNIAPNFILFILHAFFDPLLGFADSIAYGWSHQRRDDCFQLLKRLFCCSTQADSNYKIVKGCN